ncbi:MAG: hypothetical protein FJZ80_04470 [Bacteroidetes bacterium]|nr:hypothetical protein [Bacteroidota bacterium]
MTKRRFISGFCWIAGCCTALWYYFDDVFLGLTAFGVNASLYAIYLLLFIKPYRENNSDILKPSLLLITLQLLVFFIATGVFWYWEFPFARLLGAVMVFFGLLVLQVLEQIAFLKSVEKSQE